MTFNPNIPTGLVPLDQDYVNLQSNNQALDNVFGVNHTKFSNSTGQKGYHTVINAIDNTVDPGAVAGTGEYYSKTVASIPPNIEAFYQSATGIITQLTGPNAASVAANGYTWLPGGILLQWGIKNSPGSSGTIKFVTNNINFPSNCFGVFFNFRRNASGADNFWINSSVTFDNTQFGYQGSTSSAKNLYWVAIGN